MFIKLSQFAEPLTAIGLIGAEYLQCIYLPGYTQVPEDGKVRCLAEWAWFRIALNHGDALVTKVLSAATGDVRILQDLKANGALQIFRWWLMKFVIVPCGHFAH